LIKQNRYQPCKSFSTVNLWLPYTQQMVGTKLHPYYVIMCPRKSEV